MIVQIVLPGGWKGKGRGTILRVPAEVGQALVRDGIAVIRPEFGAVQNPDPVPRNGDPERGRR